MYKLIFKTILIMGLFGGIFSSCEEKKDNIYIYRTEEFRKKEQSLKISLDMASGIYKKYLIDNEKMNDDVFCVLDIIYDDYYVFKTHSDPYSLKTGDYNLSGIWINGNTGEIKNVNSDESVKLILEPGKHLSYVKKMFEEQ